MPERILMVEDNPDIAQFTRDDLESAGYEVQHAQDAVSGLREAREGRYDLVLLDLGLPDFDGTEVLARLRRTSGVPIIVVTARDNPQEKASVLERGADDYLTKPFNSGELIARMRVQFRHRHGEQPLKVGQLELRVQQNQVFFRGTELHLSPTEFRLLTMLAQQPGRVYSREDIERELWQGQLPQGSAVIDVHISNIRTKLRDMGGYKIIRTVRGVGYALYTSA